jgi:hypothetical protein
MPPSQIFVSTRSRRDYARRRASAPIVPVWMLVVLVLLVSMLAAFLLWRGGL